MTKRIQRTPTDKLIHRLRMMAEAGGMLTRDRIRTVSEAADRIEELDERVAIMTEEWNPADMDFPGEGECTGEEH